MRQVETGMTLLHEMGKSVFHKELELLAVAGGLSIPVYFD